MWLPEHLRYIVGYKEPYFEHYDMVQLVRVLSRQILNDDSDIIGPLYLLQAGFFTQDVKMLNPKNYSSVWSIPKVTKLAHVFPQELV